MDRRPKLYWLFFGAAVLLTSLTLFWAFFMAPLEATMGIVQKIFYFHVPAAMTMQLLFASCGVASMVYLLKPSERLDRFCVATAEIGVLMAFFVLITGPLWARKAWGHYWEWEPRLVLTMVLCFMFVAYVAMRSFGGSDDTSRRIGAGLAAAGLPAIWLVRVAVEKWRGTHPRVIYRGGLTDSDMKIAFLLGVLGMVCLGIVLVWERMILEHLRQEVDDLALEFMERDLLEEL